MPTYIILFEVIFKKVFQMKCKNCNFENKTNAKFCSHCGQSLEVKPENNNNSKIVIVALVVIIVALVLIIGYFAMANNHSASSVASQPASTQQSQSPSSSVQQESPSQQSTQSSEPKDWELIGTYSGSGSGSQSVSIPSGQIMIKVSAYPIKNYADNHLYVTGSNGQSAGVDWGPTSDVETRSDSLSYTSSSSETFTIDYYETVSWQVEIYRYQ